MILYESEFAMNDLNTLSNMPLFYYKHIDKTFLVKCSSRKASFVH
jgi:hypothetical protein